MTYVYVTWLADVLRAGGCNVIEESGWKNRGRPSSTGSFNPYGVTNHHTGTTSSSSNPHPTLNMCINGRSDLPGPLCQVLICYAGHCHVIAAGRANHAGNSNGYGPFQSGDGNWQTIGFEIDYNGTQDMSSAQEEAVYKANAAILKKLGRSTDYLVAHFETSTSGKWDPGYHGKKCNMDEWRSETAKKMQPAPPKPPPLPIYAEEEMPALLISDGAGPSGTVYAAPMDLSSKVAVTKTTYDNFSARKLIQVISSGQSWDGKTPYIRIDIDAADLNRIPTIDATKKPYGGPA